MPDLSAWVIGLHLLAAHDPGCYQQHGRCEPYKAATPGLYARAPSGLTFGAYRNSYGRGSAYAGWTFETADRRFALTVGGATGYPRATVIPLAVPSVRFGVACGWALRIAGAPRFEKGGAAVLHLAVERQL